MVTDPSQDEPPFPPSGIPAIPEPDYNHVRRRIRRRHRMLQASLLSGLAALAALVAVSPGAALQGSLLITQGILLLVLVVWRRQSAHDADAIACGVGEAVVQQVRRRRRAMIVLYSSMGIIAGALLSWLARGH